MIKLTQEILYSLGFRGEGKDITNNPAYRLHVPVDNLFGHHFHYQIQIVLMNLPETNPNSGIFSLYDPGIKDAHCIVEEREGKVKADFILWEDKENNLKGGIKYVSFPPRVIPIAWNVTTLERLNQIYTAITGNNPLIQQLRS